MQPLVLGSCAGSVHLQIWYIDHHMHVRKSSKSSSNSIEYSGWMGVPLGPAFVVVNVLELQ